MRGDEEMKRRREDKELRKRSAATEKLDRGFLKGSLEIGLPGKEGVAGSNG